MELLSTAGPTAQHGREFRLHGMAANASYAVVARADCSLARSIESGGANLATTLDSVAAEVDGVLRFRAHAHCGVAITFLG